MSCIVHIHSKQSNMNPIRLSVLKCGRQSDWHLNDKEKTASKTANFEQKEVLVGFLTIETEVLAWTSSKGSNSSTNRNVLSETRCSSAVVINSGFVRRRREETTLGRVCEYCMMTVSAINQRNWSNSFRWVNEREEESILKSRPMLLSISSGLLFRMRYCVGKS